MKAVILAGGLGTRISEETNLKPKPMVASGNRWILSAKKIILKTSGRRAGRPGRSGDMKRNSFEKTEQSSPSPQKKKRSQNAVNSSGEKSLKNLNSTAPSRSKRAGAIDKASVLTATATPSGYIEWLASVKKRISGARQRAVLSANEEQIRLYHDIGREILERQKRKGWGGKVIDHLSADLRAAFPGMKGLSVSNLKYMRFFAQECPDRQFVQQTDGRSLEIGQQTADQFSQRIADQLPWFHVVVLITKIADPILREWYAREALRQSWPRDTLAVQIKNQLHVRQGMAITNFDKRLEPHHADLATEILKDPYHFDFLGLGDEAHERDIENALIRHITRFLLELGAGFAFVGRQFQLLVGGDEFFIDLLFYHTQLKCYVVVELKAANFKPEHAGQLNFYLAAVDAQLKAADDRPTIGLLLCKTKKRLVAEYSLSGIEKPIGVAEYQLVRALPKPLDTCLPTIEELENELSRELLE